ncbi:MULTISPECIES: type IV secretory system conjugative DNA transfer family protein [unclassified Desulfovibrio]|uniref:type IV secretory system conjugative DNA transfer family protein n=1 Tax=unclassified Desulfovibrio TaxID=2593640 RepID=UPI002FD88BDC
MEYFNIDHWKWLFSQDFFDILSFVMNDGVLKVVAATILLVLGWCIWYVFLREKPVTTHGSAAWGTLEDAEKAGLVTKPGERVLMGKIGDKWLGAEYHSLVCAKTRGGKGVGVIIPTLLTYRGSIICNDIKGENYAITAAQREKMGQNVYVVDPYHEIAEQTHCFNPLDYIKAGSPDATTLARALAHTMSGGGAGEEDFWVKSGRNVLVTFILYVCAKFEGGERNLGKVREMLTQSAEKKTAMLKEMQGMDEFDGNIAKGANKILEIQGDGDEKNEMLLSIFATVDTMCDFLDDPRIAHVLSRTDFRLEMFKYEPSSLYVVVSPGNLAVSQMLLRMIYSYALNQNQKNERPVAAQEQELQKMKHPLVFLMDEFAQLGKFDAVKNAMPIAAGFDIRFCIIIQGLSQLTDHYKEGGQEFLNNAIKLFIGAEDTKTAEQISEMCGDTTVKTQSKDEKSGRMTSSYTSRRLVTVGEAMQAKVEKPFLLAGGMKPLRIDRITYYSDKFFAGKYGKYSAG